MANEDYVSFEQAKALKELGFDWKCYTFYHWDNWCGLSHSGIYENHNMFEKCVSAPTLAHAAKWLREKGIIILLYPLARAKQCVFYWRLYNRKGWQIQVSEYNYDTYEQELSAGIDRALELLKEQDNG